MIKTRWSVKALRSRLFHLSSIGKMTSIVSFCHSNLISRLNHLHIFHMGILSFDCPFEPDSFLNGIWNICLRAIYGTHELNRSRDWWWPVGQPICIGLYRVLKICNRWHWIGKCQLKGHGHFKDWKERVKKKIGRTGWIEEREKKAIHTHTHTHKKRIGWKKMLRECSF